jgi:CheY-like chemotaxis protein
MALVLVIDDEPKMRQMVRRVLSLAGHSVVEADDGAAALRHMQREAPAVVLTDILMPGTEGIETIFEVRRAAPKTRIIAMSGGGRAGNLDFLRLAERAGADAVLAKPFRAAELTATIDRLLSPTPACASGEIPAYPPC